MKKYICILAGAALFAACEQKTETVTPAAPADKKTENNTTIVNPSPAGGTSSKTETNTTINPPPASGSSTETSTSTTTSTPSGH